MADKTITLTLMEVDGKTGFTLEADNLSVLDMSLNGGLEVGDWVLSAPNSAYGCLVGQVIAIDKLGTPEHGTENETDDIHVDFTVVDYPYVRVLEIEDALFTLYTDVRCFDELPIDDIIMAPEMLILLPGAEFDELDEILNSYDAAKAWAENALTESIENEVTRP